MATGKPNWIKIIVGTALVSGAVLIGLYFRKQYQLLYNSCIKFAGLRNVKLSFQQVKMTILLAYFNKSAIAVEITSQAYDVYVNNMLAATVESKTPTMVPSSDKALLALDIQFKPKDLLMAGLQNINQLLFNHSAMVIKFSGVIKVKAGIISTTIPYEYEDTLANMTKPSEVPTEC